MPSASDPRQQNRTRQPASRPAQPGHSRRSVQLSLPRARRSPSLIRPNLFNGRVSSLLLVRPSLQAVPALSSRHLPSECRPPSRIRITLSVPTALLRLRARAITRTSAVVHKRKAPRCL